MNKQRTVTLLSILPWALLLFPYLFVLPRYERLAHQFALKVDDFSALLIRISAWVRTHALLAFVITFMLMIANVVTSVIIQNSAMSPKRRMWALLFIYGVPCLLFVLTCVGVLATHRRLTGELQN